MDTSGHVVIFDAHIEVAVTIFDKDLGSSMVSVARLFRVIYSSRAQKFFVDTFQHWCWHAKRVQ